jgi:hypothetical protein
MTSDNRPLHGFCSELWVVPSNEYKESSHLDLEYAESRYNGKIASIRNIEAKEPLGLELHLKKKEINHRAVKKVPGSAARGNNSNIPVTSPIVGGFVSSADSGISPERSLDQSQSTGSSFQ